MNAGFSNLSFLKKRLLLASDTAGSAYDDAVAALGLSMAGYFESECDRKFARAAGVTYECGAEKRFAVVDRYPIESVTKLELRNTTTEGWVEQASVPVNFNRNAGVVTFTLLPATAGDVVRLTYTGGFWWDTSEDNSGTKPSGAEELPQALILAWVQACKFLWDRGSIEDRAKAGFGDAEIERFITGESKWPEFITGTLAKFRRVAS
jgi:hypothetical protein